MPSANAAPEALSTKIISQLRAEAGDSRRAALDRLEEACDALASRGPIKLAAIENYIRRACGKEVGPRAQSISNEKTRPCGMYHYVEARNRERSTAGRGLRSVRAGKLDLSRMIEAIDDIDLRTELRNMHERMTVAEREVRHMKNALKEMRPGFDIDAFLSGEPQPNASGPVVGREMRTDFVEIVSILTDDAKLSACGLCYENGRVRRRGGLRDELLRPQLMATLIKFSADFR